MKLIDFLKLTEAPISNFGTIGDFDAPGDESYTSSKNRTHSIAHQSDRRIVTHPKFAKALERAFSKTDHNFNIVFVNTPELAGVYELGQLSMQELRSKSPELAEQYTPEQGAINIIFASNQGDERFPFSPWIVAHRISHAMGVQQGMGRNTYYPIKEWPEGFTVMLDYISRYLWENYNLSVPKNIMGQTIEGKLSANWPDVLLGVVTELGTFRSARSGSIIRWQEIIHEFFAQYLTTGSIRVETGGKWTDQEDQEYFDKMAKDIEDKFETGLHRATNRIFLI